MFKSVGLHELSVSIVDWYFPMVKVPSHDNHSTGYTLGRCGGVAQFERQLSLLIRLFTVAYSHHQAAIPSKTT